MKQTWQERWALWVLKPKPPEKINEALNHWWLFGLMGVFFSGAAVWGGKRTTDLLERLLLEGSNLDPTIVEKIADSSTWGFYILGLCLLVFFLTIGLICEERKGYSRIIEKLNQKAEPCEIVNARSVTGLSENHLHN